MIRVNLLPRRREAKREGGKAWIAILLVAVLASYTALSLAGRVSQATETGARWWIAGGAFAMGTGIWAMHFVGMLAFRLPIPLSYDLGITLLVVAGLASPDYMMEIEAIAVVE